MSNEELVDQIQNGINITEYMEQLYLQNKGFIYNIVRKYRYACRSSYDGVPILELEELMHEAYFGIVEAVERFDPELGAGFLTYASLWINQVVKRFLDNSGQVIRVPVHRQQEIYKYNKVKAYYLSHYNREPSIREYSSHIGITMVQVEKLEQFMFKGSVRSLDEVVPGGESESISYMDTVPAEVDIEQMIVEREAAKQIHEELWVVVNEVLQHEKMAAALFYRFKERLTLEETGKRMGITRELVRQYECKALRRLRCNRRTKRMFEDYLIV